MGKLDLIEENSQLIFHSIENNDFTFLISTGVVPLLQFISKIENTKYLFVSDDTSLAARFKNVPYQTSVYDHRFSVVGSSWLTYDLCIYLISEDTRFFELFDFIILDGVDDRGPKSEYLFSLMLNLKMIGKYIIPLKSNYKTQLYTEFVGNFGYTSNVLKLKEEPSKSVYYLPSDPSNLNKEIIKTINDILMIEKSLEQCDILVMLSSFNEIQVFKTQLVDADINHDFSILTDLSTYKTIGPHRRVILAADSKIFQDVDHRIRYIVDSGVMKLKKFDECGLESFSTRFTNKNQISQNLSILEHENSSYFGMFVEGKIVDFEYGINDCFLVQLLYLLKKGLDVEKFEFLKPPIEQVIKSAINLSIYLGLVKIEDGSKIKLTELGSTVMKFQVELEISSLSLFIALSISSRFNSTKELLKISSLLLSCNVDSLSRDLKNFNHHKTRIHDVPQSDFLTLLNIFDTMIENEQRIKQSSQVFKDNVMSKEAKKQILHCFKQLRSKLNHPVNSERAIEDDIQKCLFSGFQLHASTVLQNVSNPGTIELEPILSKRPDRLNEMDKVKIILTSDLYENNDIIIYHSREYFFSLLLLTFAL